MTPLVSHGSRIEGERVPFGGVSACGVVAADALSANTTGSAAAPEGKGKAPKEEGEEDGDEDEDGVEEDEDEENEEDEGGDDDDDDEAQGQGQEEEGGPTLVSLLANHASLDVTNELNVPLPSADGALADVRSGYYRDRQVLLNVIFIFDSVKAFSGLRQSPEEVRERGGQYQCWAIQQIGTSFVLIAYFGALS